MLSHNILTNNGSFNMVLHYILPGKSLIAENIRSVSAPWLLETIIGAFLC